MAHQETYAQVVKSIKNLKSNEEPSTFDKSENTQIRKIIYHKEVLMLTALLGLTKGEKEPRNILYLEYTRV